MTHGKCAIIKLMVSAIIPAFNERKGIKSVISALEKSPFIDEIIVVDDGSSDQTAEIARETSARVIRFEENGGKAAAMDAGVSVALCDTLLFIDGDIHGLTGEHIKSMVLPVKSGSHAMFVGVTDKKQLWATKIIRFLPLISGNRALSKKVWYSVPKKYREGFQIEVALNYFCRRKVGKLGFGLLYGAHNTIKEKKYGLMTGLIKRVGMTFDVASIMFRLHVVKRVF